MIPESAPKLDIDFTDEKLSSTAGLAFIAQQVKPAGFAAMHQTIHPSQTT